MSGVSGVSSSGNLPPMQPTRSIEGDQTTQQSLDFLHDQYTNQMAGIASENVLKGSQ